MTPEIADAIELFIGIWYIVFDHVKLLCRWDVTTSPSSSDGRSIIVVLTASLSIL